MFSLFSQPLRKSKTKLEAWLTFNIYHHLYYPSHPHVNFKRTHSNWADIFELYFEIVWIYDKIGLLYFLILSFRTMKRVWKFMILDCNFEIYPKCQTLLASLPLLFTCNEILKLSCSPTCTSCPLLPYYFTLPSSFFLKKGIFFEKHIETKWVRESENKRKRER